MKLRELIRRISGRTGFSGETLRVPTTVNLTDRERAEELERRRAALTYRPANGFLTDEAVEKLLTGSSE